MIRRSPFRYFKTGPEIIRLTIMLCIHAQFSLRNVEGLIHRQPNHWPKFTPAHAFYSGIDNDCHAQEADVMLPD